LTGSIGKDELFQRIVAENGRRLRLIAKTNARGDECRDLEQEILLQLWKSLDGYEARSSPASWFYAVAINTVREFNRSNYRRKRLRLSLPPPASPLEIDREFDKVRMIEEFLRSVGDLDRHVLLMYLDGLSYREISDATRIDEARLRMRVSRLKKQFSARYQGT